MLKIKMKIGLVAFLAIVAASPALAASKSIKLTRHNLSNWSPYAMYVKGNTTQVCVFCHAPHNAESSQAPLWNHKETSEFFSIKSTIHVKPFLGNVGQPNGISKKCLSCHDGTISIGAVVNTGTSGLTEAMEGDIANGSRVGVNGLLEPTAPGNLGTNLSGGHVISFVYDADLISTLTGGEGGEFHNIVSQADRNSMLDRNLKMQCHTCHDPHTDRCNDPSKKVGKDPLWRFDCDVPAGSGNGSVCEKCHNVNFDYYTSPKIGF